MKTSPFVYGQAHSIWHQMNQNVGIVASFSKYFVVKLVIAFGTSYHCDLLIFLFGMWTSSSEYQL